MTMNETVLLQLLKKHFGFSGFLAGQQAIINDVMAGKDTLAIMPTGAGKSLCYQLPALALEGTAIVVSPLIALMKDQVDALRANGISAAYYNSTQPASEQQEIIDKVRTDALDLIYVAPESLSLLQPVLQEVKLNLIAIDEAHCISSWGHDFRPAYTQLAYLKNVFPGIPVIALTATADKPTQEDIKVQLNIPQAGVHLSSFDRKNIYLEVRPGQNRINQILNFIKKRPTESGIIYCLSRKGTEKLADKLTAKGYAAAAYHAGLSPEERATIQEDFINDRTPIVVATIAFGMGIDKSNVRWVIHYNMPKNIEGYYQEIGRGGRDGLPSTSLMFYSYADVVQLSQFAMGSAKEEYQLAKLERMKQFAEALNCRRRMLLGYFGEHVYQDCGNCDNCKTPPQYFDGTIIAQKVCSAVARLKEQESITMVVDVLRGSNNAQVFEKGYQQVKTFGAAKDIAWLDLQQYIIQLINQGVLEIHFHENGRLTLTPLASKILYEGKNVQLATLVKEDAKAEKFIRETEPESAVLDTLKKLRYTIAKEDGIPAYVIFSDASLKALEKQVPHTLEEFADIKGVGEAKLEKYGERFLEVLKEFDQPKAPVKKSKPKAKKSKSTAQKTAELYNNGLNLEQIAEERSLAVSTVFSHLIQLSEAGEDIDFSGLIDQEDLDKIADAQDKVEDGTKLRSYFEYFNEEIPYWKLRLALHLLADSA